MMATWRRIWSLSIKEFIHLRSDWWLPVFMILGGALELLLIGWATSRPISNLPLMVLDHDRSAASRTFVVNLENTDIFNMETEAYDVATIEDADQRGSNHSPGFLERIEFTNRASNRGGFVERSGEHSGDGRFTSHRGGHARDGGADTHPTTRGG